MTQQTPIEEETLPHYEVEQYYPVHIGDVFNSRYRVAGKLGSGAYSTSWLCHDMCAARHVAVKVSTSLRRFPTATHRELRIYEHLAKVKSSHPGQSLIRELYDAFELEAPAGKHQCLVHQPMHMTVLEMMKLNPQPFNLPLLKMTLKRVLTALDFLHTDASVIHADIKTDNLMLSLEDHTMMDDFARAEENEPSPRNRSTSPGPSTDYRSRRFRPPKAGKGYGLPVLCDFGEARIGAAHETGQFAQPHIYRAPEVIFEMPWGSAIDVWNVACLTWDLFEGEHLFGDIFDVQGNHDPFKHLALMVAVAGPPPREFVQRSETTEQCFNSNGDWIASEEAAVPPVSLESLEKRLAGREKEDFIRSIRSMLQWLPERRKTAKQLLEDPWLR
ncbi:hypothetical protein VTK56DRAFT_1222 [Thermocarpiscus australiensis]